MILRAALFGLVWLLALSARAAPPTTDGVGTGIDFANSVGPHTSVSATLSTASIPDIIVCSVAISNTPPGTPNTLTGCAAPGLTFVLRKRFNNNMGSNCEILDVNPCNENVEIWEAVSLAPLAGVTITATYSAPLCPAVTNNGCRASLVVFGVTDLGSILSPHDPNAALPNTNFSASPSTITSGTYVTTNPDDLLVWYYGGAATGGAGCLGSSPTTPFFIAVGQSSFPSANCMAVAVLPVTTQVNRSFVGNLADGAWNIIGDAFTGSRSAFPQVWINE